MNELTTKPTGDLTVVPNPLDNSNPASLEELFDKDPQFLTEPDIELIVKNLRLQRTTWKAEEHKKRAKKPALTKEQSKEIVANIEIECDL